MRIIDSNLLKEVAKGERCEWCGKRFNFLDLVETHHVFKRGSGRLDIACNLMAVHKVPCHAKLDTPEGKHRCLEIVAKREGCKPSDIEAVVTFFRSIDKGISAKAIEASADRDGFVTDLQLWVIRKALATMPDQSPVAAPLKKRKRRPSPARERAKAARKATRERAKKWKADHAKA